ncbi:DUF6993 domain-containing protein [Curtobacterium sp. Leaf261]|uniref:DUF6993 domain-containing protein n=1 Tax=Curtobacterium sp. Leaf261 TaxID=1736311 RepID=UPI0012E31422|nr:hypothetical protein [Curtobacterium sp. Leaf261]
MRRRHLLGIVLAGSLALGLTSCTLGASPDRDTVTGSPASENSASASASSSATPSATATAGPEVTAAKSKFDGANTALAARNGSANDHDIVDSLVTAGFDKGAMQITPDTTSIGRGADSIEVSVLVGSTCLLGQFRGSTYVGDTAPVLGTGHCLIGNTRAIDW